MKFIAQHDISDCGVACLAMISYYYGLKYSLQKYRELTHTGKNGTSLQGIIDGAESLGFVSEALYGSFDELIDSINIVYDVDVMFYRTLEKYCATTTHYTKRICFFK